MNRALREHSSLEAGGLRLEGPRLLWLQAGGLRLEGPMPTRNLTSKRVLVQRKRDS